jgi:hypothetical protein
MLAYGSKLEFYNFEGDEEMNTTFTAIADVTTYPSRDRIGAGVLDITATDHGYIAGDKERFPNHIFVKGGTYDGLHRILSAPDANSLYVTGQFGATATGSLYPGLQFDENWIFVGYALHLDTACATAEDFVISKDSARGSSFDANIVTVPMNGVSDYVEMFEQPWPIQAKDVAYCTFANTDDNTWGLELYAMRLR